MLQWPCSSSRDLFWTHFLVTFGLKTWPPFWGIKGHFEEAWIHLVYHLYIYINIKYNSIIIYVYVNTKVRVYIYVYIYMLYFLNYVSCQHPPVTSFSNHLTLFCDDVAQHFKGHTYFKKTCYMFAVLSSIIRLIVSLLYLPKINTSLPTHFMVNTPFAATTGPQLEPQFSRGSVIQNKWCEMFPYQAVNDEVLHLFFPHCFEIL